LDLVSVTAAAELSKPTCFYHFASSETFNVK